MRDVRRQTAEFTSPEMAPQMGSLRGEVLLLQSWAPSTSGRSDDKAASLLYFDGRPQAHGLFEFLMHETLGASEAVDVPMLLAPVPFTGATLHQHVPHVRSLTRQTHAHGVQARFWTTCAELLPAGRVHAMPPALEASEGMLTCKMEQSNACAGLWVLEVGQGIEGRACLQMLPHMGSRRDGERKRGAHKIELRGVLPPWVLDRLCHVLAEAQQRQLQVQ